MGDFTFQLGSFDPAQTPENAWLLIEAGEFHLAFVSWHPQENKILALDYARFSSGQAVEAYERILHAHPSKQMHWEKQQVFYFSREQVLMPEKLHQEGVARLALNLVHGDLEPDGEMEDTITGTDIRNYYRTSTEIQKTIQRAFPFAVHGHSFSSLLSCLTRRTEELPGQFMYVQVYYQQISLVVFMQGRLYLAQVFPYEIPEDISYFLLNTAEQLRLDPNEVPLFVSGLVDLESPFYLELQKYFRDISMDAVPELVKLTEDFNHFPRHFFTPQIMLAACG
jgi:hypothetical protein